MNREQYAHYIDLFQARDYDSVLDHYAPDGDFEVTFFGTSLRSRAEVKRFYGFFHDHVKEEILVHHFISNDHMVAAEVTVRITAFADLTKEAAAAAGINVEYPIAKGQVLEVPQFVHYHLKDGKIVAALCALFQPA